MRHGGDAVRGQKFDGKFSRRPAAGVQSVKLSRFCVPIDEKEITANSVHHGLSHAEHGVRGNGCVHGRSALRQHLSTRLRRQIMAGGNNAMVRHHYGTAI